MIPVSAGAGTLFWLTRRPSSSKRWTTEITAGGGAGIATAQAIAAKGVEVVLTGNCGPNAYQVLKAAGIKVITGVSGKVQDALHDYKGGKYQISAQSNVSDHFGMELKHGERRGMGHGRGADRS